MAVRAAIAGRSQDRWCRWCGYSGTVSGSTSGNVNISSTAGGGAGGRTTAVVMVVSGDAYAINALSDRPRGNLTLTQNSTGGQVVPAMMAAWAARWYGGCGVDR